MGNELLMMFVTGLIAGVVSSLVAARILWLLMYKRDKTTVLFGEEIVLTENMDEPGGRNLYKIIVENTGTRNLKDVTFIARLSIKFPERETKRFTYIEIDCDNKLPVIYGSDEKEKRPDVRTGHILTIYIGKTAQREFKKDYYSDNIKEKAVGGSLHLEDIFKEYNSINKGKWTLTLYAFGYDAITGAKKMYESEKEYDTGNILPISSEEEKILLQHLRNWKRWK